MSAQQGFTNCNMDFSSKLCRFSFGRARKVAILPNVGTANSQNCCMTLNTVAIPESRFHNKKHGVRKLSFFLCPEHEVSVRFGQLSILETQITIRF